MGWPKTDIGVFSLPPSVQIIAQSLDWLMLSQQQWECT